MHEPCRVNWRARALSFGIRTWHSFLLIRRKVLCLPGRSWTPKASCARQFHPSVGNLSWKGPLFNHLKFRLPRPWFRSVSFVYVLFHNAMHRMHPSCHRSLMFTTKISSCVPSQKTTRSDLPHPTRETEPLPFRHGFQTGFVRD